MKKYIAIAVAALSCIFTAGALAALPSASVKFTLNADHSSYITASVTGNTFTVTASNGGLPANTTYQRWCFFTSGHSGSVVGPDVVTTDANGGFTTSINLDTLRNGLPYPATVECDFTVPDGISHYGQYAVFADGFDAYVYGKAKLA